MDSSGDFWIFGGTGYATTSFGELNDLWRYSPKDNTWTWMSGSNVLNQLGVYGTQGIPSLTNHPGSREGSSSWVDSHNNLILFGGFGYSSSNSGFLNDLWMYSPISNRWTWVSGATVTNQVGVYGTQGIISSSNIPGSREGASSWIDSKNTLWIFGGHFSVFSSFGWSNDLWKYFSCGGSPIECDPSGGDCCYSNCTLIPSSQVCRPATGLCDVVEYCNGESSECPSDSLELSGTECHTSTGPCDVTEYCSGTNHQCPSGIMAAGTICRNSKGNCDTVEYCNGISDQCPLDSLEPAGVICRNSTGPCNPAAICNGITAKCPSSFFLPNGAECTTTNDCGKEENGKCSGSSDSCDLGNSTPCSHSTPSFQWTPSIMMQLAIVIIALVL